MSDYMALAEDDYQVAGDDLGFAVDENPFSCADDTAYVGFLRQVYVPLVRLCTPRTDASSSIW